MHMRTFSFEVIKGMAPIITIAMTKMNFSRGTGEPSPFDGTALVTSTIPVVQGVNNE